MDRFKQMIADRHEYAKAWKKKTGGLVVGYCPNYMPEELAYAAGMLPIRIMAEQKPDVVSAKWIYASCYVAKNMTNMLLNGEYDYMDAFVHVEDCQWTFNVFEVASNNFPSLLTHYLFTPDYTEGPIAKDVFRSELNVLKGKFEAWTGKAVTEEALDKAIEIYNTNRRLLRQIYEMRRFYQTKILGSEMMNLMLANQVTDKAEMNKILEDFIVELDARAPYDDRLRLMLVGSETFNADLEELVESLGANVVVDELDNGSSNIWNDVVLHKDRLMALSLRYMGRPHSAMKDSNWRRRPQHIFELSEDYMVDGVLVVKQLVCQAHGSDNYAVWKLLRERNIPFHFFERDTTLPLDETRVRIESFLSMLRPGVTRIRGWHQPLGI
ncbi:MAG: 2-hydroxyacyl-CoA dehydratase [Clostridiales bacterium]|nr:2-hydroxyacyl-CoA dehydratase [Clostridiales bacterium]